MIPIILMLLSISIVSLLAEIYILKASIKEINSEISKKINKDINEKIKLPSYVPSIRKLVSTLNEGVKEV